MKLLATQSEIPFKNQEFDIRFTGEELVRLFDLAAAHEGGNEHTRGMEFPEQLSRFTTMLYAMFPKQDFQLLRSKLNYGRLP